MTRSLILVSLVLSIPLMVGCGDGRPSRVPVSGKVYYQDQPLNSGFVRFIPEGNRPATARIQPDGSFKLQTFDDFDGAVIGKHVVTVMAIDETRPGNFKSLIPVYYNDPLTSPLTEEITGPTDKIDIRLIAEAVAVDRRTPTATSSRAQSLRETAAGGSVHVPTGPEPGTPAPIETYDFSGDADPNSQL